MVGKVLNWSPLDNSIRRQVTNLHEAQPLANSSILALFATLDLADKQKLSTYGRQLPSAATIKRQQIIFDRAGNKLYELKSTRLPVSLFAKYKSNNNK
jgi:hypothetical protein